MEEVKKEMDVLDHIKKAEKVIKTNLLIKQMGELKKLARELLEIKEKSVMILEDVGVEEADIKRVIDFINSSPEVQLTENDKKEIRERVRQQGRSKRQEVQREIESHPFLGNGSLTGGFGNTYLTSATGANTTATWVGGTNTSSNVMFANSAGDSLEVNL